MPLSFLVQIRPRQRAISAWFPTQELSYCQDDQQFHVPDIRLVNRGEIKLGKSVTERPRLEEVLYISEGV